MHVFANPVAFYQIHTVSIATTCCVKCDTGILSPKTKPCEKVNWKIKKKLWLLKPGVYTHHKVALWHLCSA